MHHRTLRLCSLAPAIRHYGRFLHAARTCALARHLRAIRFFRAPRLSLRAFLLSAHQQSEICSVKVYYLIFLISPACARARLSRGQATGRLCLWAVQAVRLMGMKEPGERRQPARRGAMRADATAVRGSATWLRFLVVVPYFAFPPTTLNKRLYKPECGANSHDSPS